MAAFPEACCLQPSIASDTDIQTHAIPPKPSNALSAPFAMPCPASAHDPSIFLPSIHPSTHPSRPEPYALLLRQRAAQPRCPSPSLSLSLSHPQLRSSVHRFLLPLLSLDSCRASPWNVLLPFCGQGSSFNFIFPRGSPKLCMAQRPFLAERRIVPGRNTREPLGHPPKLSAGTPLP